jgi:hypothetical protein
VASKRGKASIQDFRAREILGLGKFPRIFSGTGTGNVARALPAFLGLEGKRMASLPQFHAVSVEEGQPMMIAQRRRTKNVVPQRRRNHASPPAKPVRPTPAAIPLSTAVVEDRVAEDTDPRSEELGADLERLERHHRAVEDRRRVEELARLRAIQRFD